MFLNKNNVFVWGLIILMFTIMSKSRFQFAVHYLNFNYLNNSQFSCLIMFNTGYL